MTQRVVLLSGHVGAGKSTLADQLASKYSAVRISTRRLLEAEARQRGVDLTKGRAALQAFGEQLDRETAGQWIGDAVSREITNVPEDALVVVDGVRRQSQIDSVREALSERVDHVHLQASDAELARRYEGRGERSGLEEFSDYAALRSNPTEAAVGDLALDADVTIDTDRCDEADVLVRCAARLGLLRDGGGYVDVIIGGQYGSEGKGNLAYYLAPEYDVLVRVGGPNAGHKVPLEDGAYTHRLLPSGTLAKRDDAIVVLAAGSVLNLDVLRREIADCISEPGQLVIDPAAMIIDGWDIEQESALREGIGSTASGTGLATARRVALRGPKAPPDLAFLPKVRRAEEVDELAGYVRPVAPLLADEMRHGRSVLLEGTQGTALSLYHGEYPYVTSRDTTASGCLAEAGIGPRRVRRVVPVCRTYPIRVMSPEDGTSGRMKQEVDWETIADRSGLRLEDLTEREVGSVTKGARRVGEFDWALLRATVELNGATDVALTFTDYLDSSNEAARRFDQLHSRTVQFVEEVESVAGVPVSLISTRFARRCIIDRRRW